MLNKCLKVLDVFVSLLLLLQNECIRKKIHLFFTVNRLQ